MASNGLPPSNRSEGQALNIAGGDTHQLPHQKWILYKSFLEGVGGGVN